MSILRFGFRGVVVVGVIVLVVGAIGAGAASSGTTSGLTNAKHFFWAQGQTPSAGVDTNALENDLIYHGGNASVSSVVPAKVVWYWTYCFVDPVSW